MVQSLILHVRSNDPPKVTHQGGHRLRLGPRPLNSGTVCCLLRSCCWNRRPQTRCLCNRNVFLIVLEVRSPRPLGAARFGVQWGPTTKFIAIFLVMSSLGGRGRRALWAPFIRPLSSPQSLHLQILSHWRLAFYGFGRSQTFSLWQMES